MGMGTMAQHVVIFDDKKVNELVGKELKELEDFLDTFGNSLADVAMNIVQESDFVDENIAEEAYNKMKNIISILEASIPGLTVHIGYHDAEAYGSRYDEVEGMYFAIEGVYVIAEEAKEAMASGAIKEAFFTVFG